jgi:c-di-GMP phosphodiesterase
MDTKCLLSRKPIFRSQMDVAAYEVIGAADASQMIFSMFTESGLDPILGDQVGYINVPANVLSEHRWRDVPSERVVLGYFDDFAPSDDAARLLAVLVADGYRIALSDKLCRESLDVLADYSEVIKVDVTRYLPDQLEQRVGDLRRYKTKILAENVDTYDDLEFCRSLEFDLYTGRFLCKPSVQKDDLPINRLAMLQLLAKLRNPAVNLQELEKTIAQDVGLSYKLLLQANSASVALPRTVTSVGHALRLIGMDTLKSWASVLLLSSVEDKPRELMSLAVIRSRMCERLAEAAQNPDKDSFALAGLLSVLDALLDCSMNDAVAKLPLADEVRAALIDQSGPVGQAVRCTLAYEQGNWEEVHYGNLSSATIREIYMDAISWSRQLLNSLL